MNKSSSGSLYERLNFIISTNNIQKGLILTIKLRFYKALPNLENKNWLSPIYIIKKHRHKAEIFAFLLPSSLVEPNELMIEPELSQRQIFHMRQLFKEGCMTE